MPTASSPIASTPINTVHDRAHGEVGAPEILLTAKEAYPRLESLFLDAQRTIHASFRVFDVSTKLRSARGLEVGQTWADLITHVLDRGVRVEIAIADFDPIAKPELHWGTWQSVTRLQEAGQRSANADLLVTRAATHPARSGLLYRIIFAPLARRRLARLCKALNRRPAEERASFLRHTPALQGLIRQDDAKGLVPRYLILPELVPATHHQKLLVVDGSTLYVGGLDLDERRFDDPDHKRTGDQTWHDVQIILKGTVAQVAEGHLRAFEGETAGRDQPQDRPGLLRTLSVKRNPLAQAIGPRTVVREIADRYLAEIARVEHFLYMETQFLRDLTLSEAIAARAAAVPTLNAILVLPAAPEDVAFDDNQGMDARFGEALQTRCVDKVREAFGDRLIICTPGQSKVRPPDGTRAVHHAAPLVYVHSKVSIFDERCAIVSSANLNGRSMRWDTEAGVALEAPDVVRALRGRLMRHWLPDDPDPSLTDTAIAVNAWRQLAQDNAAAPPAKRRGFLLPYSVAPARRFGRMLPFIPHAMV